MTDGIVHQDINVVNLPFPDRLHLRFDKDHLPEVWWDPTGDSKEYIRLDTPSEIRGLPARVAALEDAVAGLTEEVSAGPTVDDILALYNLGFDVEEAFKGITRKNTSADSWSIRQELLASWQPLAQKIKALKAEFVPEQPGTEGVGDG